MVISSDSISGDEYELAPATSSGDKGDDANESEEEVFNGDPGRGTALITWTSELTDREGGRQVVLRTTCRFRAGFVVALDGCSVYAQRGAKQVDEYVHERLHHRYMQSAQYITLRSATLVNLYPPSSAALYSFPALMRSKLRVNTCICSDPFPASLDLTVDLRTLDLDPNLTPASRFLRVFRGALALASIA